MIYLEASEPIGTELTLIKFDMELNHIGSEAPI